jgi:hypothetical protein
MTTPGDRQGRSSKGCLGGRVSDAYATRVGVDTAACHLWSLDREARRLARRRRRQRLATTTASVLLLLAGVGTVAGSATAVPGETLYSIKDGLERAELTMAVSDAASARAHVRHSRARLEELRQITESDPRLVPEVTARFYDSLERAADADGGGVSSEIEALRNEAAVLLDQLARDLDPSIAATLAAVEGVPDSLAVASPGSFGGHETAHPGSGGDGAPAGSSGDAAEGGGAEARAADPVTVPPESAVAEADPGAQEKAAGPGATDHANGADADEHKPAVLSPVPESSTVGAGESAPESSTVDAPPDSSSAHSGDGADNSSPSPTGSQPTPGQASPTPLEPAPQSATSQADPSADADAADPKGDADTSHDADDGHAASSSGS